MKSSSFCLAALVILTATSCKKESEEIKTYSVAKESPPPQTPAADPHAGMPGGMMPGGAMPGAADGKDPHAGVPGMGGGADPHAGLPGMGGGAPPTVEIKDTPPTHWEKRPNAGMRVASYYVKSEGGAAAAISLSNLRAAPSSKLNAFNMWREQLGQPVADEAALQQLPSAKTGFGDGVLVDVEGVSPSAKDAKPSRLVGMIVEDKGTAWYFKMVGDSAVVAKERDAFILWTSTVKVGESSKVPMHGTKPGDETVAVAPPAAAAPAGDGSLTWTLPTGWAIGNGSSARYATIAVVGADGTKGELSISHFPGDVGGDLANVNRWRQQVALPPVDEAGMAPLVSKVTSGPKTMSLIDVTGPQTRCAAGWARHGGDTWFFKFTGPDALVGAEKAKFTAFLESVRFTKPE
jgi:hypothetical protein